MSYSRGYPVSEFFCCVVGIDTESLIGHIILPKHTDRSEQPARARVVHNARGEPTLAREQTLHGLEVATIRDTCSFL